MRPSRCFRLSIRVYRSLLWLYPAAFQHEYSREMLLAFRLQCHDAEQRSGCWGIVRVWMWALLDLIRNVPAEHFSKHIGAALMVRRTLDIALSTLALWVGLPFLLPIVLLIKIDSPGPVFYVSERGGKNGHVFKMYKFRSMTDEPAGRRITRVGHILRQTRIDEYPQFYNVLRGEMSLLGPRPLAANQLTIGHLNVKPGVLPWFYC